MTSRFTEVGFIPDIWPSNNEKNDRRGYFERRTKQRGRSPSGVTSISGH